ncbi:helix-turn-helix domain-containing protein [Pseudoponticoccus marisrubri]|uniref:XRE family transcriptional regulator n=1 Tax=Pseudoponticoccus marisrubri TaxID=1685382 RepID=A0A0W7WG90_9RHOB|nr:helix-turn-helix domain-containing protein [Pseudoponticoccus marisrubri]KUF09651.1 XRE family transcriptional regulator [Pseudoponticoccus marisrubri]
MEDGTDWYGPDAATFGDRLTAAREAAGMSQEALAKRLGVKLATLQGWEDDHSEPRANRLSMLAGLLNVSMVWLITGEGEGVPDPDDTPISEDVNEILMELRAMRAQLRGRAEKIGRLEKRLRALLKQEG